MRALAYYLSLPFIYLIASLPLPVLYVLSDGLYFLLYKIGGYRKNVVTENLSRSFPGLSTVEIRTLRAKTYRHFCDLIVEIIKTLVISPAELARRMTVDFGVLKELHGKGQSCVVVMGHWGNWEWSGSRFSSEPYHDLYVVYHPLTNRYWEKLTYHMRTRLGTRLYSMENAVLGMFKNRHQITATGLIADQSPRLHSAHWVTFLNQDTAVFSGPARIGKKLNYPILYAGVRKVKRGYYHVKVEMLCENPTELDEQAITQMHAARLEQDIMSQPENWLWTHRRWKHKRMG